MFTSEGWEKKIRWRSITVLQPISKHYQLKEQHLHPHFFQTCLITFWVIGLLEPIPTKVGQRQSSPWMVCQSTTGLNTNIHTFKPSDKYKSPSVNLWIILFDCGSQKNKLESQDKTTQRKGPNQDSNQGLLPHYEAIVITTTLPCSPGNNILLD